MNVKTNDAARLVGAASQSIVHKNIQEKIKKY